MTTKPEPVNDLVTPQSITEASLTAAIKTVLGEPIYDAIAESSGFTAAHDRACMVAFMDNAQGPTIEILRVARRYISTKGMYPYYDPKLTGPAS